LPGFRFLCVTVAQLWQVLPFLPFTPYLRAGDQGGKDVYLGRQTF
jgi:hypothetical protein